MQSTRPTDGELGGLLAVVTPHPASVLIGSVPGIVTTWVMIRGAGIRGILSLFNPAAPFAPGARLGLIVMTAISLFLLWLGLRHIFDRAELYQNGFRFLGKTYRYDGIGPISWSHNSQNGLTRFADTTTLRFQYQGKQVKLRTRYLQDLSYQFHRVYAEDPVTGNGSAVSTPQYSNSVHRAPR